MHHLGKRIIALLMVLTGMSACSTGSPSSGSQFIIQQALIEQVEIAILESFPLQVHVRIQGILDSSCTTLYQITQQREENIFFINCSVHNSSWAFGAKAS